MGCSTGFDTAIQRKISALVCSRIPTVRSLCAYSRQNRIKAVPSRSGADKSL
jgi:hypothetical protein